MPGKTWKLKQSVPLLFHRGKQEAAACNYREIAIPLGQETYNGSIMREIYRAHQHNGRRDVQDITVIPYFRATRQRNSIRLGSHVPQRRASNNALPCAAWRRTASKLKIGLIIIPRCLQNVFPPLPHSLLRLECLCLLREIRARGLRLFFV